MQTTPELAIAAVVFASSFSPSWSTESGRGARSRRLGPRLPRAGRRTSITIAAVPELPAPLRPALRAPGELAVLWDLFSVSLPSCTAVATVHHRRPPLAMVAGAHSGDHLARAAAPCAPLRPLYRIDRKSVV